ncbi:MAG: PPC domain-containing protein [Anaerolineae bacterium]|nr:PPC domain-containing protein [Anaerolineae bacterium]
MKLRRIYVLVILLVLLTACGGDRETTPTLQGALVPTRASPIPTASATVSPSVTPSPSSTFDATRTQIASLNQTQIASGSATALSIEQTQTETARPTLTPTPSPTDTATETFTPSATVASSETAIPIPTLTLTPLTPITPTAVITVVPDFANALPIIYGETVRGSITNENYFVIYRFEAGSGDVITIQMQAVDNDLDTLVILVNSAGERLIENDDRATGITDSLIDDFTIPEAGTYFIIATRFQEQRGTLIGAFDLTLTSGDTPATPPADAQMIEYGANVRGTITDDRYQYIYLFEGLAGDVIEIRMAAARNSDLDTFLYLYAPDESLVAQNDDFNGNSRISLLEEVELPQTGTYRVVATRYNEQFGGSSGNFNLMLNRLERGSASPDLDLDMDEISYGDLITDEIAEDELVYFYTFEGNEGDRIMLSVNPVQLGSTGLDPIVLLLDRDGHELIRSDDTLFGRSSLISNYPLPYTGNYIILVGRSPLRGGRTVGEFRLLLNDEGRDELIIGTQPQTITDGETVQVEFTRNVEDAVITFEGNSGDTIHITLDPDRRLAITVFLIHPLGRQRLYMGEDREITVELPLDGFYSLSFRARRGQGEMDITLDFE